MNAFEELGRALAKAVDESSRFKQTLCPWCDDDRVVYLVDGIGVHDDDCPYRVAVEEDSRDGLVVTNDLEQIKTELALITSWPWEVLDEHHIYVTGTVTQYDGHCVVGSYDWESGGVVDPADAPFIAKAPERIAALVAEVERLEQRLVETVERQAGWISDDLRFVMSQLELTSEQRAKLPEILHAMATQ